VDIKRFDEISNTPTPKSFLVWQDWREWQTYLEFVCAYFKNRGVTKPLVVEIGILHNEQRAFYKELLNADYIGMDIEQNNEPDILGDSAESKTVEELKRLLGGELIDLLFIDGNHSYEGVKADFENYSPLTKHLIAFHDVHSVLETRAKGVHRHWNEMCFAHEYMTAIFHRYNTSVSIKENKYMNEGIGVVILK